MHGWIILDKPLGLGSTQGVSAVKRALRQGGYAKTKVGHGGTLDPLATGVLPIALGEATKLAGRMLDATKTYVFEIAFGSETDTLDAEGEIVARSDVRPTTEGTAAILSRFQGPISQVPPAYSALKINGKRSYDLARAGDLAVPAPRDVLIHELTIWNYKENRPFDTAGDGFPESGDFACFRATVSKGTYIRSLARDIAHALSTVGHVTMLRRTKAGPFDLTHAISLDKLDEAAKGGALEALLRPIEAGLDGIPALNLTPDQAAALRQGRVLVGQAAIDGLHFAKLGDMPVALVKAEAGEIRVERGFNF